AFGEEGRRLGLVDVLALALASTLLEMLPIVPARAQHVAVETLDGGFHAHGRERLALDAIRRQQARDFGPAEPDERDHVAGRRREQADMVRLDGADALLAGQCDGCELHGPIRSAARRWR